MTDRVHPSSKPNGTATANPPPAASGGANANTPRQFPPAKSQQYNPMRHPYRPNPDMHARHNHRRCTGRRCFCLCCFWSVLVFLCLLLLIAVAGAAFYVLYRPQRPDFSVSSLKFSRFNLSTSAADDTTRITSQVNFTLSSKNPNKKITFYYNPVTISLFSSQVLIANGAFSNFTSNPGDVTIVRAALGMTSQVLDPDSAASLRADLKRKNGLPMSVEMETKMKVKMDKLKSTKVGIKIVCGGIHGVVPNRNASTVASFTDTKCKVNLQIKIWKFNF